MKHYPKVARYWSRQPLLTMLASLVPIGLCVLLILNAQPNLGAALLELFLVLVAAFLLGYARSATLYILEPEGLSVRNRAPFWGQRRHWVPWNSIRSFRFHPYDWDAESRSYAKFALHVVTDQNPGEGLELDRGFLDPSEMTAFTEIMTAKGFTVDKPNPLN